VKPLDFMIIGAQKSATTALYAYLADHPEIAMPRTKEAPFFDGDICDATAWQQFSGQHFAGAESKLWGKASPQYMGHPEAASRIHALMPKTRLIAILRDPVQRAWSHYQMERRRELEPRSFDQAVTELLQPQQLSHARQSVPPRHAHGFEPEQAFYLAWSEYGRILADYLEWFPREQLLVLTTDELKHDPAQTLDRVLEFIGLPAGYRPADLGKVIHKGGGAPRIPVAVKNRLKALAPLHWLWQCVPPAQRDAFRFWYEQHNVRQTPTQTLQLSESNRVRLQAHFAADGLRLQQDLALDLPWL